MKFFKLVFAELRKIILKPSIFILIALLVGVLSVNGFLYNPTIRNSTAVSITGDSVNEIKTNFNSNTGTYTKYKADLKFENEISGANAFVIYSKADNTNIKDNILDLVDNIKNSYQDFSFEIESQTRETLLNKVNRIKSDLTLFSNSLENELTATVAKIIMSVNDFNAMHNSINDFNASLTSITDLSTENEYYILNSKISAKKYINNIEKYVKKLQVVSFNKKTADYLESIYTETASRLEEQYNIINNYEDSTLFNVIKKYNVEISKYIELVDQATNIIQSTYTLNIKDDLTNYYGFEDFNKYSVNYELTQNKYLFNHKLYSFEVAQVFNSNTTSNFNSANCYDFIYNTMLITSLIIIIYSIILATSSIASEYSSGTIKLLLIRPYSRNKILSAKILATILFSSFFIILSSIVSFIIGSILFGISSMPILVVLSAKSAFLINPFMLSIIFLFTTLIKCSIYILISILISSLFRNPIASIVVALSFYFAGLVCNMFVSSYSWAMILPFANFDLFNYFLPLAKTTQIGNLFTGNYVLTNIFVSIIYDIVLITALTVPSYYIFKHNDI